MSTVKSKKLQVGTDASASNNFTIYQPASPDGTLRIGVGNADSPTEVGRFNSNGYVATNAPAFSAYQSSGQSISNATATKIIFDTEEFDTNSNYDNATNYRFTPTVAGYYQFTTAARLPVGTGSGESWLTFYKNGSSAKRVMNYQALTNTGVFMQQGTALIYMNGSTDYVEVYIQHSVGSSQTLWAASMGCYFQGFLARAA